MNTIVEHINSAGHTFVEFALPMLIQSSVLIVILLFLDLLLRKKVKAVFRYWIWMLVLIKLILPTSLSSPLSLGYLFGEKLTYEDLAQSSPRLEPTVPAPAEISSGVGSIYIQPNPYIPPKEPVVSVTEPVIAEPVGPPEVPVTPLSWQGVVFLVWMAVVIAMGLLLLQRALFVRGLVAQAKKAGQLMNDALSYCCESMGIKSKVGLKISVNATTPSVCGLIRPVILVPWKLTSTLGASRLKTILMHELAHIRRGDLWVNLVQTALQIIYFYNPLLWLANFVIRRIREQAVDEAVLVVMGEKAQKYPQTLVDVAKMAFKRPALGLRLIGVVESKSALAGRIKHILGRPLPKSARLGIVSVLSILITAAILLPMARARETAFAGQGGPLNIRLTGIRPDGSDDIYDGGGNKIAENTFVNIANEWGEDEQHRTFIFELPKTEEPILFPPFLKIKPAGAKRGFGTAQHPLLYYSDGKLKYCVGVNFPRTYKKLFERRVKEVDLTLPYYYGRRGAADFVFTGPFTPGQTVKAEGGADCELTPKEDLLNFGNHPAAFFRISSETRFNGGSVLIYDTSGRRYLLQIAGGGSGGTHYNYRAEGLTLNSIACVTVGEKPYEATFKNVVVSYPDRPVPERLEFLDEMYERLDLTGFSGDRLLNNYTFENPADAVKVIDIVRGYWFVMKVFRAIRYSDSGIGLSNLDSQALQKVRSAAARWAKAGHPRVREMGIRLGLVGGWPEFMDMALDWLEQDVVVYDMLGRAYRGLEEEAKEQIAVEVASYPIALNSEQAERLKKIILSTDSPRLGMRLFPIFWRADEDITYEVCRDLAQDDRSWIWWPAMYSLSKRCNDKLRPFGNLPEKMQKRLILVHEAKGGTSRLFDVSSSGKDYETVAKEAYAMLPAMFTARLARMNGRTCHDVRQVMAKNLDREIAMKAMTDFLREISTESNQRLWAGDSYYFGTCCSTAYCITRHINSLYDVNIDNLGKYETRENSEAIPRHISQLKQLIVDTLQWYDVRSGTGNKGGIAAEVGMADRVEAQAGPLDHFIGKYALAGHPDTAAFEITKKGDVFAFRDLGGPKFEMDIVLRGLAGRSFEMEKGRDNLKFGEKRRDRFCVRYEADEDRYILDGLGMRGEVQDGVSFPLTDLVKVPAEKPDGTFAATLPNGVTVEMVGICEHPSEGKQWWRPDGTLLEDRPYEEFSSYHSLNGGKGYELVWRLSSDEDVVYEVESADQGGSTGQAVLHSERGLLPAFRSGEFYGIVFFFSQTISQAPINIGVGLERNWKTIALLEGDLSKAASSINNVHLYPAIEADGRTYIDAAYRFTEGKRQAYRLVAVDTSNRQHIMQRGSETKGRGNIHCRKQIDLPLKQIKTIHFQTQPLQWITFENVSLRPGLKTDVQVEVEKAESVSAGVIEAVKTGVSLPIKKIFSGKTDKGGSFEWETSFDPRVRFRHGWYTVEDGVIREYVGASGSQIPEEGKLNLKLDVEVKDNMLNLKVQRVHDLDDDGRTAAVAGKTPVPAGAYLKHDSSIDSAVLSNKHLTLWQGDFIRDGKVLKSVIYAAYLTTPDDPETGFKPPKLQKAEFVTPKVGPDVPVVSLDHFVGRYALAAHPDTAAFEITKKGDVFIFRDLGGPKFEMDILLRGLKGRKFEMEKGRDNLRFGNNPRERYSVRYNAAEGRYILDSLGMRGEVQDGVSFPLTDLVKISPEKPADKTGVSAASLDHFVGKYVRTGRRDVAFIEVTRQDGVFFCRGLKRRAVEMEVGEEGLLYTDGDWFRVRYDASQNFYYLDELRSSRDPTPAAYVRLFKISGSPATDRAGAEGTALDHFLGKYARATEPDKVNIEITKKDGVFVITEGRGRGFEMEIAEEGLEYTDGDWFRLRYNGSDQAYYLDRLGRSKRGTPGGYIRLDNISAEKPEDYVSVWVKETTMLPEKLVMLLIVINSCAPETDLNIESVSIKENVIKIGGGTSDRTNTRKFLDAIKDNGLNVSSMRLNVANNRDKFSLVVEPKQDWQKSWQQRKTDVQLGFEENISPKLVMLLVAMKNVAAEMDLNIESISVSAKSMSIEGDTSGRTDTLKFLDAIKDNGLSVSSMRLNAADDRDKFSITAEPKENWRQGWQKRKTDIKADDPETGFKPPVLQKGEIVTAKVGPDVSVASLDHFVGRYAMAKHPDTAFFEITKEGDVFIFRDLGGPKFEMEPFLKGLGGRKFEMEKGRDNLKFGSNRRNRFRVRYNAAEDRYILDGLGMRGEVQDGVIYPLTDLVKISPEKPEDYVPVWIKESILPEKLAMLLIVINSCAAETDLNIDSISITDRNISIKGNTSGRANSRKFLDAIKDNGLKISQVSLLDAKGNRDKFSMIVEPKKDWQQWWQQRKTDVQLGFDETVSPKLIMLVVAIKSGAATDLNIESISVTAKSMSIEGDTSGRTDTLKFLDAIKDNGLSVSSMRLNAADDRDKFSITAEPKENWRQGWQKRKTDVQVKGEYNDELYQKQDSIKNALEFIGTPEELIDTSLIRKHGQLANSRQLKFANKLFSVRKSKDVDMFISLLSDGSKKQLNDGNDRRMLHRRIKNIKNGTFLSGEYDCKFFATFREFTDKDWDKLKKHVSFPDPPSHAIVYWHFHKPNYMVIGSTYYLIEYKGSYKFVAQTLLSDTVIPAKKEQPLGPEKYGIVVFKQNDDAYTQPGHWKYQWDIKLTDEVSENNVFQVLRTTKVISGQADLHPEIAAQKIIDESRIEKYKYKKLKCRFYVGDSGPGYNCSKYGQKLSGWLCGLSIAGTFKSTYMLFPGKDVTNVKPNKHGNFVGSDLELLSFETSDGNIGYEHKVVLRKDDSPEAKSAALLRLEQMTRRQISKSKLQYLDRILTAYANDNNSKYPDRLIEIKPYDTDEWLDWLLENIEYSGKGKTLTETSKTVIAYDKTLLEEAGSTHVLFNEGPVQYCDPNWLKKLGITAGPKPDVPVEVERTGEENQVVWGKPIQGVQVGVKVEKTKWRIGGDVPRLNVEVRISDPKKFRESGLAEKAMAHDWSAFALEIDGKRYKQNVHTTVEPVQLRSPFKIVLFLDDEWQGGLYGEEWLTPGRHKILVLFVGLGMKVASEPVEIEILPEDKKPEPWPYPWGQAVRGVQVSAHPAQPSWPVGSEPVIRICLRNQGREKWSIHERPSSFALEVDGKRYENNFIFHVWRRPFELGDVYQFDLKLSKYKSFHDGLRKGNIWPPVGKPPTLLVGKHTVRVLFMELGIEPEPASRPIEFEIVPAGSDVQVEIEKGRDSAELDQLLEKLKSGDHREREAAAQELGELRVLRAVDALIAALKDTDVGVRKAAARALGKIGDERAVEPLIETYQDKEYESFVDAIWALGDIGGTRAEEILVQALSYQGYHPSVRNIAAKCLTKLGWKPANREQKIRYLIALEKWEQAIKSGPSALLKPAGTNQAEGPFELNIPIVIPLEADKQAPAFVKYPWLQFSTAQGKLRAALYIRYNSWPHTKWVMKIDVLDAGGKVLGQAKSIHSNSGIIKKIILVENAEVLFEFDRGIELTEAASFRFSIESFWTSRGNPIQFDKELPLALELNSAEHSRTIRAQWLKFQRSGDRVEGTIHLDYLSWPKAKWKVDVYLLDENGTQLTGYTAIIENSGIIVGRPIMTMKDFRFSLGKWGDISKAVRYGVTMQRILDSTAKTDVPVETEKAVVGEWEDIGNPIPADFNDTIALTEKIKLGSIGRDVEGKSFITFVWDREKDRNRQYRFVLINKNDAILEPDSHLILDENGRLEEKFTFDETYVPWRLKEFKFQSRPLPLAGNRVISSKLQKDTSTAFEGKTISPSRLAPPGRYAIELDGVDDYLLVPDSPTLRLNPPFTIEMWIKPKLPEQKPDRVQEWGMIAQGCYIGTGQVKPRGFGIQLTRFEKEPATFHVSYQEANDKGLFGKDYGGYRFDEWMHISHVFEGENYKPSHGHPLVIGRFLIPMPAPFFGQIGEVRIWNGARTPQEIPRYKNRALTGKESGLAACWTFEQADGQFAYDISGNNNHARFGKAIEPDGADPKWIDLEAAAHQPDRIADVKAEVAQSGGDSVYGNGDIVVVSEGKSKVYGSIQEAIDAAQADSVVRIGPGVYEERLEIDRPLTLEGAGWDKTTIVTENNTADAFEEAISTFRKRILEAKSEEHAKKLSAELQAQFVAEMKENMAAQTHLVSDTENVVIRNLKLTSPGRNIEGRSLSVPVIKFSNAGALVTGCAIVGTPGNGINIQDGSDVEIRESLVAGVWSTGIAVAQGRGGIAKASIINCDVRNCHHRGITIGPGCDSTVVRGCRISGSSWHGIRYDHASPTIVDNLIFANVRFGIYASGRTAADVRQNLFYGNELSGISCWFKNQDKIEANTFVGNMRSGLEVLGASRPIVRKNIFYANPTGILCANIANDSPSAASEGTANLEENLFWGFEYKVAWQHSGDTKDEIVTEELELDEKARNVIFDPEFKNITAEDFSLKLDSPARRSGIGASDLIDYKSPWPLQDEEIPIIPEDKTEDTSWMGQISSTGKITRPVVVPVENRGYVKPQESIKAKPRKQEGSDHPGRISGVVINSDTGDPIVGAYVGVGDFGDSGGSNYSRHRSQGFHDKIKTDAEGRFELGGLVFTDKHRYLKYHPLVVTHPDFVRHDRKIKLPSDGPAPDVKVNLVPAAKIEVTIVDADGNPLPGQWLLRLEALDGRRFIPPGSDPHLSSFASNIWAHWPDLRTQLGVSNGFTFTELDTGEYSIEALKFQLVDKPTPGNIWKPTITYHGSIPNVRVQAGQAKQVRLKPQDHQTQLTITHPEYPDKLMDKLERSSQMPLMCLISRSPGALLWDDGKIRHLEDQRLGRIDKKRFFRGFFVQGKPLTINNLPPDSYSLFTMAVYGQVAGYLIGARADLEKGDKINVDIPWRQPTGPSMFGPNRSFDYPVNLEARDYSVSQLCKILTDITQSNPRIIADQSIENEKLNFGRGQMSVWDLLEKLYLDKGWRLDEGQDKTLIIKPAEQTNVQSNPGQDESNSLLIVNAVDNKAALTSGVTVELLGLTYIPVEKDLWWSMDGSPLPKTPFDDVSFTPSVDPNWQQFAYYTVAMQIKGKLPREIGLIKWNFTDAVYGGTTSAYANEMRVYSRGIIAGASKFPKDVETTTLRLGLAAGDWQNLVKGSHYGVYREGEDSIIVRTPERAGGPLGVHPGEKGLHIGVTYNVTDRDFRVVAVDKDDKVHLSSRGGSGGTQNLRHTTASFPELTHDRLQEFRFQVRPYEWVEFKDVSLRPSEEAFALAGQRRVAKQKELEKWLGQGKERQIRQQILILRESLLDHINEPCMEQTEAISAMRELVRIGEPAVQELTTELRQTEHWLEKSLIAFVLRAIGSEYSVPVLIEVLAQSKYRGGYGIYVKDDELAEFMLDHQHREPDESDRKVHSIIIACPVIEITKALEKITEHSEGPDHFTPEAAEVTKGRWQKWWEQNRDVFMLPGKSAEQADVTVEGEETVASSVI